jgi:hypothetical protein
MQRILKKKEGNFIFGYFENSENINDFVRENITNAISIEFIPSIIMTQNVCLEYTNAYLSELIIEAKSIMKENESFYQNFEIHFKNFTHFSLISHDVDSQKKAVSECSMFIECVLKSNVITEDNK